MYKGITASYGVSYTGCPLKKFLIEINGKPKTELFFPRAIGDGNQYQREVGAVVILK